MPKTKPFEILLIDDNPADVRMVLEGLKEALPAARLSVAGDGAEALRFLRHEGNYAAAPRPRLILLDLRLPKKSGFKLLEEVKTDAALLSIPLVVQSSSVAAMDVNTAYRLHANSYISKPSGVEEWTRTMQCLTDFWVTVAKLPEAEYDGE